MNGLVIAVIAIIVIAAAAFLVYSYYPTYSTATTTQPTVSSTSATTTIVSTPLGAYATENDLASTFQLNNTANWTYGVNYCSAVNPSLNSNGSICNSTNIYIMNVSKENFTGWIVQFGSFGILNFNEILVEGNKNSTQIYNNFTASINDTNSTFNGTENGADYVIISNSSLFTNKIVLIKGNNLALITAGGLEYNQSYNQKIVSNVSRDI